MVRTILAILFVCEFLRYLPIPPFLEAFLEFLEFFPSFLLILLLLLLLLPFGGIVSIDGIVSGDVVSWTASSSPFPPFPPFPAFAELLPLFKIPAGIDMSMLEELPPFSSLWEMAASSEPNTLQTRRNDEASSKTCLIPIMFQVFFFVSERWLNVTNLLDESLDRWDMNRLGDELVMEVVIVLFAVN
jgi:hypothetical protein